MHNEKLLLIPGPTPVHPRITQVLSLPTVSHVSPVFIKDYKEALSNLKKIVFCQKGEPFLVAGAGTLSMEMAVLNLVEPKDDFLVISQGYFGKRMKSIADSFGLSCDILESDWGLAVTPAQVKEKLSKKKYSVIACTHVDTATGACAPVEEYARIARDHDAFFIIDGVCATGGIEERMTDWDVDVILTAAQKCFGAPPGLAVVVFSDKAMKKREAMPTVPGYYADVMRWLPIMKDPSNYFSTPGVNEIRAFAEATRIMLDEKMPVRFARHQKIAAAFRSALNALGFSFFTADEYLADTLSVVKYPQGIDDALFREALASNGVIVAGGLGPLSGIVFRMGHMGNLSFEQVDFAVHAVEQSLETLNYSFKPNSGVNAARDILGQ
jgi:alanine-glyoxylate transaminase / serine-glyoxylate transaminase / serine-pyruvate transaminase